MDVKLRLTLRVFCSSASRIHLFRRACCLSLVSYHLRRHWLRSQVSIIVILYAVKGKCKGVTHI